jgi:hypothetical protein
VFIVSGPTISRPVSQSAALAKRRRAFRAELRAWASVCLIKTIYLMA